MKKPIAILIIIAVWIITLLAAYSITQKSKKVTTFADDKEFTGNLEVYSPEDIYYINLDSLYIETEATDVKYQFKSLEALAIWLSDKTAEDTQP